MKRANISPSLQTVAPKNHFRRFPCFRNLDATSDKGTKRFGPQYAKRETRILRTALQLPILQMKRLCKFEYLRHKLDFCGWHDVTVILWSYIYITPHQKGTQVKFWLPVRIQAAYEPPWCRLSENKKIKKIYRGVYFYCSLYNKI